MHDSRRALFASSVRRQFVVHLFVRESETFTARLPADHHGPVRASYTVARPNRRNYPRPTVGLVKRFAYRVSIYERRLFEKKKNGSPEYLYLPYLHLMVNLTLRATRVPPIVSDLTLFACTAGRLLSPRFVYRTVYQSSRRIYRQQKEVALLFYVI